MTIDLDAPLDFTPPKVAAIGAIKLENVAGQWLDVWVTYGTIVDKVFVETVDPHSGTIIQPTQIHMENGLHPLDPTMSLRKCDGCNKWYKLEAECTSCKRPTVPYDGWTRLTETVVSGPMHTQFLDAIYTFLTTEQIPDPSTWTDRPLVKGVVA